MSGIFRRHGVPLAVLMALSLEATWPILQHLSTAIVGWEGDNLYYIRAMWWMKRSLLDLGISPLFDPTAYYPVGYERARGEMTLVTTTLGVPITYLWGPLTAYNVMMVFSFVATGWATYGWVYELTGRRTAAVVAGTMVSLLPMRFAHLPGHLPHMSMQWIALTLWASERFFKQPGVRRGAWLGAAVALVGLDCWYYGYALSIMLPLYVVLRVGVRAPVWRTEAWWTGVAMAVLVALVMILPALVPTLRVSSGGKMTRTIAEMEFWAMSAFDPFIPNLQHPLWGKAAQRLYQPQHAYSTERMISLGYAAMLLASIALLWRTRRRPAVALFGVAVAAYLVALGPFLHVDNRQVRVPVAASLVDTVDSVMAHYGADLDAERVRLRDQGTMPLPLPSFFMYFYMPFAAGMRVMTRFMLWAGFMTAALAGLGAVQLVDLGGARWRRLARAGVPIAAVALIAFESQSMLGMFTIAERPIDRYLRDQRDAVVIELPLAQARRGAQDFYATVHQQATVLSWYGDSYPPPVAAQRIQQLLDFPSAASLERLRRWGVTHLVFSRVPFEKFDEPMAQLMASPLLKFDCMIDNSAVFLFRR